MTRVLLIISLFFLVACTTQVYTPSELVAQAKSRITEVSVSEVTQLQNPILVDVREPYEYKRGHLPEAQNIPRGRLEWGISSHPRLKELNDEQARSAEIVVYCRSGARGALAADTLQKLGYTNVRSIAGGFLAWEKADQQVTK